MESFTSCKLQFTRQRRAILVAVLVVGLVPVMSATRHTGPTGPPSVSEAAAEVFTLSREPGQPPSLPPVLTTASLMWGSFASQGPGNGAAYPEAIVQRRGRARSTAGARELRPTPSGLGSRADSDFAAGTRPPKNSHATTKSS